MMYKERMDPLTLHHIHSRFAGYMLLLRSTHSIAQIICTPCPEINVHIKVSSFLFYSKDI